MSTPPRSGDASSASTKRSLLAGHLLSAETSREGDRVTTLELFFDLVYVFAFTQVTYLMSHGEAPVSIAEGLITLGLLWWSWTSYSWLSNQAHADRGIIRTALIVAMAAMFIVSLVIPEAFHDLEGGLYAPLVFAAAYAVARVVHIAVYIVAAGSDAVLRRQIIVALVGGAMPSCAALFVGAALGGSAQLWIWGGAIVFDLAIVWLTSRGLAGWRLNSAAHFSERHGLIVILALGESIVAIGVGVSQEPISTDILIGSLLAIALAVGLWWNYFHHLAPKAEHRLARSRGRDRMALATEGFTYLHYAIVAGIILSALGIEQVMAHLDDEHLGTVGAWALGGGIGLYVAGTALFWARMSGEWAVVRFTAAAVAVAVSPLLADPAPLVSLAAATVLVWAMAVVESLTGSRLKLRRRQPADTAAASTSAASAEPA